MRVRDAIRELPGSRIAEISALGMGDPEVIPLWYGEGDLPTPDFIGTAAAAALRAGHTFYTYKAGLPELRATLARLHDRSLRKADRCRTRRRLELRHDGVDAGDAGADRRRRQSRHHRAGMAEHRRGGVDHGRRAASCLAR